MFINMDFALGMVGAYKLNYVCLSGERSHNYTCLCYKTNDDTILGAITGSDSDLSTKTFTAQRDFKGRLVMIITNRGTITTYGTVVIGGTTYTCQTQNPNWQLDTHVEFSAGDTVTYNLGAANNGFSMTAMLIEDDVWNGGNVQKVGSGESYCWGCASAGVNQSYAPSTSAETFVTADFDVSDVSSAHIVYIGNASYLSVAELGYIVDGVKTQLTDYSASGDAQKTIDLSGATKLQFYGNTFTGNSGLGLRAISGYVTFS